MTAESTARELPPGDPLGIHRVLEAFGPNDDSPEEAGPGPLPQAAWRLDNDLERRFATELLVDVATLNIDAASFRQMLEDAGARPEGVAERVLDTVRARGKQHNPVTGSGGMLLGRIAWVGSMARARGLSVGDRIATLASLSLTPLRIDRVLAVHPQMAQLDVEGQAVVFASAPLAKLPEDLPERLALAALDVAGAAPAVARRAAEGGTVLVLGGGGKSGLIACVEARRRVGTKGRVFAVEQYAPYADDLASLRTASGAPVADQVFRLDARDALAVREAVRGATSSGGADLTLSCVNVGGAEMSAICATRDRGTVVYFAMTTSFTADALGAEGIGSDVDLLNGNGYAHGHAEHTLDLLRSEAPLRALLARRVGG